MNTKQWTIMAMIAIPLIGLYFNVLALFFIIPLWLLRPRK